MRLSFIPGAPKKWAFLKGMMNIIDVLSILPYFISVFLIESNSTDGMNADNNRSKIDI